MKTFIYVKEKHLYTLNINIYIRTNKTFMYVKEQHLCT